MFQNLLSKEGRIRRLEYWISTVIIPVLAYFFVGLSYVFLTTVIHASEIFQIFLGFIFIIVFLLFMITQGAKRCHDVGYSGIYQFIPFFYFYLLFVDGEPFPNKYGDNPKGWDDSKIGNTDFDYLNSDK